ncbi:uncharacterized protein LOC134220636 [Armigeres subalbatus]|uniref:uncharacterized protein LOC134220636 n=1 Tax=Armigeres subalbatus TaxID=124917 RepID=UPI002ED6A20A
MSDRLVNLLSGMQGPEEVSSVTTWYQQRSRINLEGSPVRRSKDDLLAKSSPEGSSVRRSKAVLLANSSPEERPARRSKEVSLAKLSLEESAYNSSPAGSHAYHVGARRMRSLFAPSRTSTLSTSLPTVIVRKRTRGGRLPPPQLIRSLREDHTADKSDVKEEEMRFINSPVTSRYK